MAEQNVTFTADGSSEIGSHSGRYSQLTIGKEGAANFGGGELKIQKKTLDGGVHTIRTITEAAFAGLANKTLRLELPDATRLVVALSGSTSPQLYVEFRNQQDR